MKEITNLTSQPVGIRLQNAGMVISPRSSIIVEDNLIANDRYIQKLSKLRLIKINNK
jgi:hypothetical protein